MIKVLIKQEEKKLVSLKVSGHANSAPHGEDLVCAAVSAVLVGGLNNLANPKDFDIKISEGNTDVIVRNKISSHDEIVLETIITSLKTIEESYGKFIQIKNI
ncbi:MAG: ribosomal-processing cysteine protease Prp [Bacilli bacterium]|nr:ribosomal-processing cysteine protease Prp [Bacilli bacterium]